MSVVGKATADRRAEARKRLAAAKAAMKKENVFPLTFDAGFFKVSFADAWSTFLLQFITRYTDGVVRHKSLLKV